MSTLAPSDWIVRWSHLLQGGCKVLDVACGGGRHLQWFAQRGHPVLGIDIDTSGAAWVAGAQLVQSDTEGQPWPLLHQGEPQQFGAVVVTNYLWRPLMPTLLRSLAPDGVLLYETFAAGNETVGRPARADFLLQPGELLQHFSGLHVVAYECGVLDNPTRYIQRIAAVRRIAGTTHTAAYCLSLK
jgi:SAM-dependent methyltransferase